MSSTSQREAHVVEQLFRSLTSKEQSLGGLTDLFVRVNLETGELGLYGDDDELITSTIIFAWVGIEPKALQSVVLPTLRSVVEQLQVEGYWEHALFEKPFSIELVDAEFTTVEVLLFVDDELLKLTSPLLANLDAELSEFIDKLLKE